MFLRRNVAGQQFTVPGSLRDQNNDAVTAGASIYLNGSNTAGGGTLTHWRNGAWRYTPTQAETDVEILELVLEATDADPIVASARTTGADPNDADTFKADVSGLPTAEDVALLSRTWSGALLEAGESYSWPVDYPIEVTDPQVSVKVNGVEVATATASGTGTSFVFVFAVPAGVALGDTVLVETAEDQPRAVVTGQVVEATDTVEAEGFAQVLPGVALSEPRARETTLRVFLGETVQQSLTLYQSDGETPLSVDGKSLELVVETRDGADVAVYGGGDITISGDDDNIVSWSWTSPVTERRRTLQWTLRDDDTPRQVYARGAVDVIYAAKVDP